MNTYNNTTKKDIKDLNAKQTVIIEVVTTTEGDKKKVVKNIYLGNWKRRQDAYYLGMVEDGMKVIRKGETTKNYRLLKLSKALAEVSVPGYNTKTNYFITESYDNDVVVKHDRPNIPEEVAANPEVGALQEDLGLVPEAVEEVPEEVVA
jgi:hypothetical protein